MEWRVHREANSDETPLYILLENQQIIFKTPDCTDLFERLEWTILLKLLQNLSGFLQLHAAGLVIDERALLLIGPSGSGKTTLTLSMLLNGWKCLSDEIALIESELLKIWPFPRAFHVYPETLNLFPGLKHLDSEKSFADSSGKKRLDPVNVKESWSAAPAKPAWLIFPSYTPGGANKLIPIGETEALSLMIDQTINFAEYENRGLDILIQLIRTCECYKLISGDVNCACSLISDLAAYSNKGRNDLFMNSSAVANASL